MRLNINPKDIQKTYDEIMEPIYKKYPLDKEYGDKYKGPGHLTYVSDDYYAKQWSEDGDGNIYHYSTFYVPSYPNRGFYKKGWLHAGDYKKIDDNRFAIKNNFSGRLEKEYKSLEELIDELRSKAMNESTENKEVKEKEDKLWGAIEDTAKAIGEIKNNDPAKKSLDNADDKINDVKDSLKESLETGIAATFMDLINQEYSLLSQYESAQVTLEENGEDKFNEVLDYIKDDINIHIGMLQAAIEDVNPSAEKIDDGKEQASELLILDESLFNEQMSKNESLIKGKNKMTIDERRKQRQERIKHLYEAINNLPEVDGKKAHGEIDMRILSDIDETEERSKKVKASFAEKNKEVREFIKAQDKATGASKEDASENRLFLDEDLFKPYKEK